MTAELFSFKDLNLSDALLKALDDLKFETPSPVQQQTIPHMLQKRDLIGQAQTGTGKTAAFALPILEQLKPELKTTQALVLAPTRELAIQVAEHFEKLSVHQRGTQVTVLCGGQDYRPQLKKLRDGAQIVVGTPGRILDHIDRGTLDLSQLSTFVLDEADEMLRMGFIEDVETILSKLPDKKQIALFSATMPPRIRQIAHRYLTDPVSIEIRMATATVQSIEQRFLFASQGQKPEALLRLLSIEDAQGVIVFVRTKSSTEDVASLLQQHGHRAVAIHGDITQNLREKIIHDFKRGSINILVATDVAARGLDVDRVTHVINYDMAHDCETYVHRIGRTGRAGRSGMTTLFATPKESRMLGVIERHTRQRIEKIVVPNDYTIQTQRQLRFMANISERLQSEHLPSYRNLIEAYLKEHGGDLLDVAAVLALMFHQDKPFKQELSFKGTLSTKREENPKGRGDAMKSSRSPRKELSDLSPKRSQDDYPQELFRLDVGRVHGVKPGNIVGAIANEAGIQSRYITGLKIHDDHSTVRLPKGMAREVVRDLTKAWVCGRQLNLTSLGAL
jgi:ATP-dependent RNA helicase DeaD